MHRRSVEYEFGMCSKSPSGFHRRTRNEWYSIGKEVAKKVAPSVKKEVPRKVKKGILL